MTQQFVIPSILDLLLDRTRLPWLWSVVGLGLVLVLLPFVAAWAEGILWQIVTQDEWRYFLNAPVGIVYILLTVDMLAYLRLDVVTPLRPLIRLDDVAYNRIVQDAARIKPRQELAVLALGPLIAFALFFSQPPPLRYVTYWVFVCEVMLAYSLLSWVVYRVVTNTRFIGVLHAQPMQIDIFDIEPFEPVGRYSLRFTVTFLGMVALSAFFIVSPAALSTPQFWIGYIVIIGIPIAGFFLGMRHTHRVLAETKQRELNAVQRHIADSYRTFKQAKTDGGDSTSSAQEINAWFACQHELKAARTWPYNTEMLSTLAISVMAPIATGLVRVLGPWLTGRM